MTTINKSSKEKCSGGKPFLRHPTPLQRKEHLLLHQQSVAFVPAQVPPDPCVRSAQCVLSFCVQRPKFLRCLSREWRIQNQRFQRIALSLNRVDPAPLYLNGSADGDHRCFFLAIRSGVPREPRFESGVVNPEWKREWARETYGSHFSVPYESGSNPATPTLRLHHSMLARKNKAQRSFT
jgi:hypothetical protein